MSRAMDLTTDRLLKRRQIRESRPCAIATACLLRRVVASTRSSDPQKFMQQVQEVGQRLTVAQPKELAVGNIVRRVMGLIRDEQDETRGETEFSLLSEITSTVLRSPKLDPDLSPSKSLPNGMPGTPDAKSRSPTRPPLLSSHAGYAGTPPVTSMFSILNHPTMTGSGASSPLPRSGTATPNAQPAGDLRAELIEGIGEIIDELDQAEEQIANYALEHIHPNEVILTYSSSNTVQKFLLKAASKRKFTVIHAEAFPNDHQTHALVTGNIDPERDDLTTESFQKPLTVAGITVILIPDAAIFTVMSHVNKVILGTHAVLANGALMAFAGTKLVAKTAKAHGVPVIVLSETYKLSPQYPHDPDAFVEFGDPTKMFGRKDRDLLDMVTSENPIFDFVEPGNVDLFVTNLGGHAPGYLYRIIRDQYREEDLELYEKPGGEM